MKELGGCLKNFGFIVSVLSILFGIGSTLFYQYVLHEIFVATELDMNLFWIYITVNWIAVVIGWVSIFTSVFTASIGAYLSKD